MYLLPISWRSWPWMTNKLSCRIIYQSTVQQQEAIRLGIKSFENSSSMKVSFVTSFAPKRP